MAYSAKRPSGHLITTPLDSDKVITQDTVMCVHCGRHWIWDPGSGRRRGLCLNCNGITCGNPKCDPCIPFEQRLENIEAGKNQNERRIIVTGGFNGAD